MRIRNSQDIEVFGGRIALNEKQAINIYENSLLHTNRNFDLDPVIPISNATIHSIETESNGGLLKTDGFEDLLVQNIDWEKATLSSNKYYGDVREHAKNLVKFETKHNGFRITTKDKNE